MTYTAPEMLTILAALGVLITGVGAVLVNIIVALKTGRKMDESLAKTDGLVNQVHEVHTLTNSNLSAVKAELATASSQIQSLRDIVQDLKAERAKADVLVALGTPVPPSSDAPGVPTLKKIEQHTKQTADNTAATDRTVNEIQQDQK